ncbi:hypothetical protein A0256_10510 [Mucilaginibacter sp. PAMC 26640]|nr:hypothetical protein A0256_10510 [Mucilaginibacter sp. PAMC 26640]
MPANLQPLVTIIIPLYNAAAYIEATILSALGQTWPNTEVIIIDDQSTDESLAIANKYRNKVTVLTQINKGASAARNLGLKHAGGKYIQFLDADDILSPDKIAAQVEVLNGSNDYIALCGTVHFNDTDDYTTLPVTGEWFDSGSDDPVDFLIRLYAGPEVIPGVGGMIQTNAWLTPKSLIDKAGPWNEFRCPDDDGEFFARVILAGKGVKFSKKGINYYRKHLKGKTLSAQKNREAFENLLLATDLKLKYLREKTTDKIVERALAKHYWQIGVAAYPAVKDVSARAINQANKYGYSGPKYVSGKASMLLSRIFGWKAARLLSFYKHGY